MQWNTDLEEALRTDPYDEGVWSVLEDWTLGIGDLRATVIEAEKARDGDRAQALRWDLARAMFGEAYDELHRVVSGTWRAGYLVRADVKARALQREAVLPQLLALRCTRLLRSVYFDVDGPAELERVTRALVGTAVRELTINAFWKPPNQRAMLPPALLAPLSIEVLHLHHRAIALPCGEPLARLRELWLTPGSPDELRDPFRGALPRLAEVAVYAGTLAYRHGPATQAFDELFAAAATPALRRLHVRDGTAELQHAVIARLAESPLLAQLERFSFGYGPLDLSLVPPGDRAAFERFA